MPSKRQKGHQSAGTFKAGGKSPRAPRNLIEQLKSQGLAAFETMQKLEQKLVWDWAKEVIHQYESILEKNPGDLKPVTLLSASKEDVALAIKASLPLYIKKNLIKMVAKLISLYNELGAFQDIDPTHLVPETEENLLKQNDLKKRHRNAASGYSRYVEMAVAERKRLQQDITGYVSDIKSSL